MAVRVPGTAARLVAIAHADAAHCGADRPVFPRALEHNFLEQVVRHNDVRAIADEGGATGILGKAMSEEMDLAVASGDKGGKVRYFEGAEPTVATCLAPPSSGGEGAT